MGQSRRKRFGQWTRIRPKGQFQDTRRHDAWLTDDELAAFFLGVWVGVTSSNVLQIHYESETDTLWVQFLNYALYMYPRISLELAESFAKSPSKGGWVWDYLRWPNRPYVRV